MFFCGLKANKRNYINEAEILESARPSNPSVVRLSWLRYRLITMSLEQAKSAIDALASNNEEANKWLVEFETTSAAWDTAQALLLDTSGTNYRFHGANMFYNKIRRDFLQLQDR